MKLETKTARRVFMVCWMVLSTIAGFCVAFYPVIVVKHPEWFSIDTTDKSWAAAYGFLMFITLPAGLIVLVVLFGIGALIDWMIIRKGK